MIVFLQIILNLTAAFFMACYNGFLFFPATEILAFNSNPNNMMIALKYIQSIKIIKVPIEP